MTINENGSRKMITKREALAKQVANKGATGDLRSIKLLFEMLEGLDDRERVYEIGNCKFDGFRADQEKTRSAAREDGGEAGANNQGE